MSAWGVATSVAIWTLLTGSVGVFVWFLAEVIRIARRRAAGDPQRRSSRSSSTD